MSDSKTKMRCFKISSAAIAALAEIGPDATQAIRDLAEAWDVAGQPVLPEVAADNVTRITQRHSAETWGIVTAAGNGNASAGVRRLVAWGVTTEPQKETDERNE